MPAALTPPASKPQSRRTCAKEFGSRRSLFCGVTVLIGLMLTIALWSTMTRDALALAESNFDRAADRVVARIRARMHEISLGVKGIGGLLASRPNLSDQDVRAFVERCDLTRECRGPMGFGVIRRVQREDVEALVAERRAGGADGFEVRTSGDYPDLYVITTIEPLEVNRAVWGFDIGQEPRRREAAERAMLSGEPAISSLIHLVQDARRRPGFLYLVPIYSTPVPPRSTADRASVLVGLAYAPMLLDDALQGIFTDFDGALDVEVFDEARSANARIFDLDGHLRDVDGLIDGSHYASRQFYRMIPAQVGGRTWLVAVSSTPAFEASVDRTAAWVALGGGLVATGLMGWVVWALGSARHRAISLAREMTHELSAARDQAEAALRRSQSLENALGIHAIVSVTDSKGTILDVNEPFCRISGYSREELIGQNHRIVNSGYHAKEFFVDMWRTISAGQPWRGEVCNRAKDGSRYWVDSMIAPSMGKDGRVDKYISIRFDITAKRRADQELRAARDDARMAAHAKSEFLANMSHEIRTPLTAILGYADILADDPEVDTNPERRGEIIATIRTAGQHLLTVINDILDLSKIEAGRMTVEKTTIDLCRLIEDTAGIARPRAVAKGVMLSTRADSPFPSHIISDPTRLRQILINLLGNAAKFTDTGTISLCVRAQRSTGDMPGTLVLDVEDTGPGLTRDQAVCLFRAFEQADTTVTRKHGGTGLGLTICRRLATLIGGSVELDWTEPGAGSRFRVTLPLTPAPNSQWLTSLDEPVPSETRPKLTEAVPKPASLRGRILLAEDGDANQRLISHHLTKAGGTVEIAANGKIALEMLVAAHSAGAPFDLLVTDIQMPEMDGYALAKEVRKRAWPLPVIALTAHAMAEDRDRCLAAGCDDFATKPIDRHLLIRACARLLNESRKEVRPSRAA